MHKQMYTPFIFLFFLFNIFLVCKAQNIDSLLSVQRIYDPQEKVYIHFDKNYYNPGETIWFKAYLFAGVERSLFSKNFYAELIDDNGNVFKRLTAPIAESSAAGNFDLPANLLKSVLYFRAYTTAMLNGDTSFIYVKAIQILTKSKPKIVLPLPAPTISFLPEGGDLIADMQTVLAFKATDANGLPFAAKGYIKASNGTKIIDFSTIHNGMGLIKILPQKGEEYTAVWKDSNGKEYTNPLPPTKQNGVLLQVSDVEGGKKFILQRSLDAIDEDKSLRIIAYMNQQLVYYAKVNLSVNTGTSGIIPTKQLPSGIMQVTIFDKNFKPVAERISFVNNHDYEFDADAWIPVLNKTKRGLNSVEVLLTDTFPANLSLSITDADLNIPTSVNEDNIISHFLLTGDLRGKVVNPYYYFFSTADSAAIHLDLVMLTHGWRRYNWDNILAGKFTTPVIKENNYLSIAGKVIGVQPGRFPPNAKITGILQTKDSSSSFIVIPIDKKGELLTDGLFFYDYAKLYFQFNDKTVLLDKSLLQVDNGLWKGNNSVTLNNNNKSIGNNIDTGLIAKNMKIAADEMKIALQRSKKEQVLQEVIVKGKVKTNIEKLDEKYASGMFSGGDSRNFDVANDPFGASSLSVFQYLQGKVAGLQISNATSGAPQLSWRGGSPVFYLNEMQTDVSMISSLNMNDVAYIKVFSPSSAGVISSNGGGAISIYTKKGSDANQTKSKGLDHVQITGYTPIKQFYAPDYATVSPLHDLADLRTTLYWTPYIVLDKTKKRFKIKFYNNDITQRFRIVLEGINANDKLIHVEKVIE